jgi:hypothetical protein
MVGGVIQIVKKVALQVNCEERERRSQNIRRHLTENDDVKRLKTTTLTLNLTLILTPTLTLTLTLTPNPKSDETKIHKERQVEAPMKSGQRNRMNREIGSGLGSG